MKLVLSTLAVVFLVSSCASLESRIQLTEQVFADEGQRFELTVAADTAALRAYLHPELLYIHSNGLEEDIEEHLLNVGGGKIDYQSFTPKYPTSAYTENGITLVDGLVNVSGLYEGYEFSVNLRYTAVYKYAKANKQWQLLRWQSTKIEED